MIKKMIFAAFAAFVSLAAFAMKNGADRDFEQAARLAAMGEYDAALKSSNASILADPSSARLYVMRGMIMLAKGDYASSKSDFEYALSFPAEDAESLRIRAMACIGLGKKRDADAEFAKILELEPKTAEDFFAHAAALASRDDFKGAVSALDSALEADGKYVQALVLRASLKAARLSDIPGAKSDIGKALELDPENGELLVFRGHLSMAEKDFKAALADFRKCESMFPNSQKVRKLISRCEAKLK